LIPLPSLGAVGTRAGAMLILELDDYGEFLGLLHHSPHSVLYEDDMYLTALHLFEARKFLYHRPDIADRIRLCERVEEVAAISAEMEAFTRRDWVNVRRSMVSRLNKNKFHPYFALRVCWLTFC
jgi:predicted NAD-dependent protein-ADP-ribosyltransferase YbiA (DUF1768 family)